MKKQVQHAKKLIKDLQAENAKLLQNQLQNQQIIIKDNHARVTFEFSGKKAENLFRMVAENDDDDQKEGNQP